MNRSILRTSGKPLFRIVVFPGFRKSAVPVLLLSGIALAGCATPQPPQIAYDSDVPALPSVPAFVTDDRPKPLHLPPAWTPAKGGTAAGTPVERVESANAAARVQPRREGYYNAIQIYPWSEGALYQVHADHRHRTGAGRKPDRHRSDRRRRHGTDRRRYRIRFRCDASRACAGKTLAPGHYHQLVIITDRRIYMLELRSAQNPTCPPSPGPIRARRQDRAGAFRPCRSFRRRLSQLPLWPDRGQSAMEAGLRL